MSAFVEHDFQRGFLLDEVKLRKLHEIIVSRLSSMSTTVPLTFKVYRGDSYSYETESVQDVANEDNEDWRSITRLELIANIEDQLEFKLSFSGKSPTLTIIGTDRDAVFLLFSDVREYINNEVLVGSTFGRRGLASSSLLLALVALAGIWWSIIASSFPTRELAASALASSDLPTKVDFLISDRARAAPQPSFMGWMLLLLAAFALLNTDILMNARQALFPSNVFLFGERKRSFDARRHLLSNIFWVVIVGAVVSVAGGVVVWLITRQ